MVILSHDVSSDTLDIIVEIRRAFLQVLVVLVELVVGQYYACSPFCVTHE
jgi:hypothetical protein